MERSVPVNGHAVHARQGVVGMEVLRLANISQLYRHLMDNWLGVKPETFVLWLGRHRKPDRVLPPNGVERTSSLDPRTCLQAII